MTTFFNTPALFANGTAQPVEPQTVAQPSVAHSWDSTAVKRVNMRDYGFEQSGVHRGDATALDNLLRQILNGRLIDENANLEQQQAHQARIGEQIADVEKQTEDILAQQQRIREVEIPQAEATIRKQEEAIHQIRVDAAAGHYDPNHLNRFRLWKYGIVTVLGLLYVVCFYVSAVYAGMIRNIGAEIESSGGSASASTLFANIFVKGAFTELDFHWIAPVLLLMFAFVLDFLWENLKGWRCTLAMVGAALVVLLLDALIAYKIEEQSYRIRQLMALEDPNHHWYSSADFWIVVVMGFVATLAWGVVLYAFKAELAKTDPRRVVSLKIQRCLDLKTEMEEVIFGLKGQLADLEGKLARLHLDIKYLREQQRTLRVSLAELEKSVSDFYDGWLAYLNSRGNCEAVKEACKGVVEAFSAAHLRKDAAPYVTEKAGTDPA